jgi:hypothetical protein
MIRFALPALLIALPAATADLGPRPLTVTRSAPCPLMPVITGPGYRHMGEPGTYVARWDWGVPRICRMVAR